MRNLFILGALILFGACSSQQYISGTFQAEGFCGMCKDRIESGLKSDPTLKKVQFSIEKQLIRLRYDSSKTNLGEIQLKVSKLGYNTPLYPADSAAYEALPACCQKPEDR